MDVSTIANTSPFFWGYLGAASSLVFSSFGAGYGTYKVAQGIAEIEESSQKYKPVSDLPTSTYDHSTEKLAYPYYSQESNTSDSFPFKFFIPIIISGVLAIYGLIYSVVALGASKYFKSIFS